MRTPAATNSFTCGTTSMRLSYIRKIKSAIKMSANKNNIYQAGNRNVPIITFIPLLMLPHKYEVSIKRTHYTQYNIYKMGYHLVFEF